MKLSNRLRLCACVSGAALLVAVSVDAFAKETRVPLPKPAPHKRAGAVHFSSVDAVVQPAALREQVTPVTNVAPNDLAALRQAFDAARKGKIDTATELQKSIADPAGRKLVEWMLLRSNEASAPFERYAAFVNTNANWPSIGMFRRRAEGALWDDRRNQAMVLSFFAQARPLSAKGKLALARALLAQGERSRAYDFVREAWWQDGMSKDLETQALEAFPGMLTLADHKVRMDRRLYAEDQDAALRAALRLGGAELAIAKARMAVSDKTDNVKALLEAVPAEARADIGYTFSYMQYLRRNDRLDEASKLMLAAPRDLSLIHDSDEWWTERRLLARKLLDAGDAATAYRITRDAVPPSKENPRSEHQFTAGWIALRFLDDPASAAAHFARVGQATSHPATLARAHYWQGRAAEALGQREQARGQYEAAARFSTAYYGQIARGRLGNSELVLRRPPSRHDGHHPSARYSDIVRAAELLYALNERDLVITFVSDLGEHATDLPAMAAIADLATRHGDARSMLFLGKPVLARGLPFDTVAYPDFGVPKFGVVGPEIERSLVYAIVRQESAFNSKAVSTANAIGLMQVTPGTGRAIAKKFGIAFDRKRLLNDASYNAQLGAAELANLIASYRGSYILAFAAYNAGPGRVREWIERYGDPRRPGVDPVDWVERIPFSETRNYVQRVMENFQVYRVRLGNNPRLTIDSDLRRGAL